MSGDGKRVVKVLQWWNANRGIRFKVELADGTVRDTYTKPDLPVGEFPDADYLATALARQAASPHQSTR